MQRALSSVIKQFFYIFLPLKLFQLILNTNNAVIQLSLFAIGSILLWLWLNKNYPVIFLNKSRPTVKNIIELIIYSWSTRFITLLLYYLISLIIPMSFDHHLEGISLWNAFFISVLFSPVVEEVFFRGIVLHRLVPFGIGVAFIFNALIFALGHLDALYVLNAFALGIVFSYAAYTYGLRWSIMLHALWNGYSVFVLNMNMNNGTVFTMGQYSISSVLITEILIAIFNIVCFIYVIIKLIKNRVFIKNILFQYMPRCSQLFEVIKNPWFIGYTVITLAFSFFKK